MLSFTTEILQCSLFLFEQEGSGSSMKHSHGVFGLVGPSYMLSEQMHREFKSFTALARDLQPPALFVLNTHAGRHFPH